VARGAPGYLGPYRLLNVVHSGHASLIWQAYDDANGRMVCVKTVRGMTAEDREQLRFLRQEYAVGRNIKHPRVIEMYAFGWDRGDAYLVMEWFPAPNLKQRLLQGREKLTPLLPKVIEQAAEGLSHFHSTGWVHRDVKPDNFLVTDDGDVKLIDFALATRRRRWLAKRLMPRAKVQGTKSYMSPEQIRGQGLDQRADLYGFACMIYELIAGKPPFTGMSSNDLLNKHIRSQPPALEAAGANVTPAFAQLVRRSLAKDPDARPKSVDDFLNEFRMMHVFKSMPHGKS
jgi:eukaryotic-like serine/threonine-protein kinase